MMEVVQEDLDDFDGETFDAILGMGSKFKTFEESKFCIRAQ